MIPKATIWSNNVVNPPRLFELVNSHFCRSNMITSSNIDFVESLHLKTLVYVGDSALEDKVQEFIKSKRIQFVGNGRIPLK